MKWELLIVLAAAGGFFFLLGAWRESPRRECSDCAEAWREVQMLRAHCAAHGVGLPGEGTTDDH